MSWARLDDSYDTNAKLLELTEQQRWRWTRVLLHCARHRSDGLVTVAVLKDLGLGRTVATLVNVGLLDPGEDGIHRVHDWSEFNPKDSTKTERQARWRAKHPVEASTQPSTSPSTQPSTVDDSVDASVDTETVYSRVGAPARPVPSRPKDQKPSFLPSVLSNPGPEEGRQNLLDKDRLNPAAILATREDKPPF